MEELKKDVVTENINETDDAKAFKFLQLHNKKEELNDLKNTLVTQQKTVLSDDELLDILDERIENISVEDLKKMTDEEINEIYNIDGKEIELTIDNMDKSRANEFKRDFLLFKKASIESFKEIDATMERFEKEIQEEVDTFNETVKKYGDISGYLRASIVEKIEKATDDKKEKYQSILDNFDNAFEFNNIYMFCKEYGPEKVLREYKYKNVVIVDTFVRTVSKLKLDNFEITNLHNNIEIDYLSEKYHENPNLFIFAIFKFIAHQRFDLDKSKEGVFLSQLNVNLKKLAKGKFSDEDKEKFLDNIKKVLDLFYN